MRRGGWVTAALLAVAVTACGDDAGDEATTPPAEWAATVCGEVAEAVVDLDAALAVINELPGDVQADDPLGEHADDLRDAFGALPEYVDRYLGVVEGTPTPDTPDGAAFRDEPLTDLEAAAATFGEAAEAARGIDDGTTVEDFFGGVQAFAGFPEALAAADLDFGDDAPPGIAEAVADDTTCRDTQNAILFLLD